MLLHTTSLKTLFRKITQVNIFLHFLTVLIAFSHSHFLKKTRLNLISQLVMHVQHTKSFPE